MGHNEYGLQSLADEQLLSGLASIVHRRNQITAEFLAYLAELDERQLFLDLGFSSLFDYCVVTLKLCESTAGRHIGAARVCRRHPEAFALVASGKLHASALSLLKKHLTAENAAELFELCTQRSARKVEELLAARFPRPDVRDLVRRLPARGEVTLNVGDSAEHPAEEALVELLSGSHSAVLAPTPAEPVPLAPALAQKSTESSTSRRIEPLSVDRYGIHFTADGEFCELLERVRGLAAHRLPSGDLMTLLMRGLEAYERELEKERFAVGSKTRRGREAGPASDAATRDDAKPETALRDFDKSARRPKGRPNPKRKRRYSAAVRRAVFLRDGKQCSYVSRDGRRCGAQRCLELDHIEPVAVGGEDTIENLRLRCRAHNQRYARQYFGVPRVNAAIRARRRRAAVRLKGSASEDQSPRTRAPE